MPAINECFPGPIADPQPVLALAKQNLGRIDAIKVVNGEHSLIGFVEYTLSFIGAEDDQMNLFVGVFVCDSA